MKKNAFTRKKIITIALLTPPLLLLIPFFMLLLNRTVVVFPISDAEHGNARIEAYADNGWQGKSSIDQFYFDKQTIVLSYTLRSGTSVPMVFISTWLNADASPYDLSGYSNVVLRIKEATPTQALLFIKTVAPGITAPDGNPVTLRHNQFILRFVPGRQDYQIHLNEFITPGWWLKDMQVPATMLAKESFTKVVGFDLQFNFAGTAYAETEQANAIKQRVVIERLAFTKGFSPFLIVIPGILICYYLVWILLAGSKGKKPEEPVLPFGEPLKIKPAWEDELKKIVQFVEKNYHNPEISTNMLQQALGIPATKIFHLLKTEYRVSFKQLINKMRITEAKRLLRETDLKVIDVAFNLGFNDITYFNKLFKQETGRAPSSFREKQEE